MITLIRHVARRMIIVVSGEAAQSGVHFVLNLGLLHRLPPREYGVFALVMVMGGLGLTYVRSLTAMPASIWIGRSRTIREADAYDVTFGSAALILSAMIAVIVVLILHGWGESGAALGGFFVGFWSLRSHMRTATFARGEIMPVAVSDAVFTICGLGLSIVVLAWDEGQLQKDVFALLSLANVLGIGALIVARGNPVRISLGRSVRRRYLGLWRPLSWSGVGITTTNLQGQGLALVVAALAGPAGYAPIAASVVLFVPVRIFSAALVNIVQAQLSAVVGRGEWARVWQQALTWTAVLGGVSLLYGAAVVTSLPLLHLQIFNDAPVWIVGSFAWAISCATMLYVMPRIILEAVGALRMIAFISAISAVIGISTVAGLLLVSTPAWSMAGGLLSELTVLIGSWLALHRWKDQRRVPAGLGWTGLPRRVP